MKYILLLLISFLFQSLNAQKSTNSAGGSKTDAGGSISYSIGQVFYTSTDTTTGTVSQGVQQVWVINEVTSVKKTSNIKVTVFPNPVAKYLNISIKGTDGATGYNLIDLQGRLVFQGELQGLTTKVDLNNSIGAGEYVLQIFSGKKTIKTFKIIKNK